MTIGEEKNQRTANVAALSEAFNMEIKRERYLDARATLIEISTELMLLQLLKSEEQTAVNNPIYDTAKTTASTAT
jgi:hypothetical protein